MAEQENDRLDSAKDIIQEVLHDNAGLSREELEHSCRIATAAALVDIAVSLRHMRMSAFAASSGR